MNIQRTLKRVLIWALVFSIFSAALPIALADSFKAVVTADKMIVREGSTSSSQLLGFLSKGTEVTVLDYRNGIAYIEHKGNRGYALVSDMKRVNEDSGDPEPPAPPSVPSLSGTGIVTVSKLPVYASASTSSKLLGNLSYGATVTVLATNNGWAKLKNGSRVGYAHMNGLDIYSSARPTPTPEASQSVSGLGTVTVDKLNVYASANVSSSVLGAFTRGATVTVLSTDNGWAKLKNGSRVGYALLSGLSIAPGVTATPVPDETAPAATPVPEGVSGPEAVVTASKMYVYQSPSVSSKAIGALGKGTAVTVLDYNSTWAKIYLNGNTGYAKRSNMRLTGEYHGVQPEATVTPTPTPSPVIQESMKLAVLVNVSEANIYESASESAQILRTVSAGYSLTILGHSGDWALVAKGNAHGYMLKNTLVAESEVTMEATMNGTVVVTADSLPVYKFASASAPVYDSYKKGTEFTLLAYNGDWAMLQRGDAIGYAQKSGLAIVSMNDTPELEAVVNLPALINKDTNVYAYATENSKKTGAYTTGTEITVLGYDDVWCLIEVNGAKSYALRNAVTLLSSITLEETDTYPGIVTAASVPVYRYASEISQYYGSMKKGTTITVLAQGNGWAKIDMTGNKGYVKLDGIYVQMDEFISPTVKDVSATVVRSATAYSCALENDEYKLGSVSAATNLTITAYTDKWARATVNGKECYLLRSALSSESYTTLKAGQNSGSEVLKMQKALEDLGYFDGLPAGNFGSLTTSALQRFQKQLGIEATGEADIATLRVLYSASAPASPIRGVSLSLNSEGSDVLRLQTRLTYKGYMNGSLDGEYGPITQKAVKLYQEKAGLSETGTADSATMKSLFSSSAPTNPSGAVSGSGTGSTGNYSTDASDDPASGTGSSKTETVIEWALAQLGKKYVYGEEGPNVFDCSGFTQYCYKKVGVKLNRSAQSVGYNNGKKIESMSDLVRGDLVCFNTINDNDLSDHVGIYLGNNKFIHASSGAGKVVISTLNSGYYARVFSWGRRVL